MPENIKFSIVGDIAFTGRFAEKVGPEVFSEVSGHFLTSNLVIGNLESPLTAIGDSAKGKCTLRGSPQWAAVLKKSGFHVVSLANNHLMDYGEKGLFSTIDALDTAGIKYLGAGHNQDKANRPLILTVSGRRIALIARSSVVVAGRCYAEDKKPGVAWFDVGETIETIKECKSKSDFVMLLLHWGLENYSYPSPKQRSLAREVVHAGADAVIGHHPHVLQGAEMIDNSFVAYSLGNFFFDDFTWSFSDREGQTQNRSITLSIENRESGILDLSITEKGIEKHSFHATFIGSDGTITFADDKLRDAAFSRLGSKMKWPWYKVFWHLYAVKKEWGLRVRPHYQGKMNLVTLKKVRPRHFFELFKTLRRSSKIMSQKSTNPYE